MTAFGRHGRLMAAMTMMAVSAGAFAQDTAATAAPHDAGVAVASPDSCAAAFATIMAEYLKPELARKFPGDTVAVGEFVSGVRHAFQIKHDDAPYFFGVRSGFGLIDRVESMQEMGFPFTPEQFCDALSQAIAGKAMDFDARSADDYLRKVVESMNPVKETEALSAESQRQFLDAQKAREGVHETASGLLYEVITEGEGAMPSDADKVRVTYTGRLADGTVFDETDRPVVFPLQGLVAGFSEGLKLMKTGGEYRLFIPPQLGYGDRGAAGVIPPGAALDFTVRLLDVIPAGN